MKLSPDDIAKIEAFIDAYVNKNGNAESFLIGDIKNQYAAVHNTISALRRLGIGFPRRVRFDRKLAQALREQGYKDAEIARHFDVTRQAVCSALGAKRKRRPSVPIAEAIASIAAAAE